MTEDSLSKRFEKAIAVYSISLIIFGTIGNFCAFLVCLRKNIRKTPTFIFTAFALLSDIITLYWWNVDHYVYAFYNYLIEDVNIEICRVTTLFQCFSFQWSAWLLVFMTIERYLSVQYKKWRSTYFKARTAVIVAVLLGLTLFIANLIMVFFIDYDTQTTNVTCYTSTFFPVHMQVNILVYGLTPYICMMISNGLLIYCIVFKKTSAIQRSEESNSKRKSLSITVLIITNVFILASTPVNILNAFFLQDIMTLEYGYAVLFFCDCMAFTHHALHFLVLSLSNKQFLKELKACMMIIYSKNNNRVGITANDSSTNTGTVNGLTTVKTIN